VERGTAPDVGVVSWLTAIEIELFETPERSRGAPDGKERGLRVTRSSRG
jgi:hypothetical protein